MVAIADVMTAEVVTVTPETPIRAIAELLYTRRISGVPVVDGDRRLLVVVGEGDLITHTDTIGEQRPAWWLKFFSDETDLACDYVRTHGRTAGDKRAAHSEQVDAESVHGAGSIWLARTEPAPSVARAQASLVSHMGRAAHHVLQLVHPERLGQSRCIAEQRRRPIQISLTGHQDERNASPHQFVDRRIDTRLAQLNVQQCAVDAVRAYCPQRLVEAAGWPDDRAFEGDKDLADKLRDEQFVLGNEHPQTTELPKLIHCQTRRP